MYAGFLFFGAIFVLFFVRLCCVDAPILPIYGDYYVFVVGDWGSLFCWYPSEPLFWYIVCCLFAEVKQCWLVLLFPLWVLVFVISMSILFIIIILTVWFFLLSVSGFGWWLVDLLVADVDFPFFTHAQLFFSSHPVRSVCRQSQGCFPVVAIPCQPMLLAQSLTPASRRIVHLWLCNHR